MEYLLTDRGRIELEALVKVHSLFAFDFDGTLAKIVRDRHAAQLGRPIRLWLGELSSVPRRPSFPGVPWTISGSVSATQCPT